MYDSVENLVKKILLSLEFDSVNVLLVTTLVASISTYFIWRHYKKRNNKPNSILKKNVRIVEEKPTSSTRTTMTTTATARRKIDLPRIAVNADDAAMPQCPFQAIFNDMKRTREAAEAAEAVAAGAREEQNRDFLDSQLERDKIIEERLIDFTRPTDDMFLLHQLEKIELSKEDREKEMELKKSQLKAIFDLLKKQEEERAANPDPDIVSDQPASNNTTTNSNEFEFSVLKEDGTYEKKEIELKKDFESQLKLYGL